MKSHLSILLMLAAALLPCLASVLPDNNRLPNHAPSVLAIGRRLAVTLKEEEVWTSPDNTAVINCEYATDPAVDVPVTITWKVGDGPRLATDILKCSGYTKTSRKCTNFQVLDSRYAGRVSLAQDSPALIIQSVNILDNLNYWCQVSAEQPLNVELETDMRSAVLRIQGGGEMPKFHSVKIGQDTATGAGSTVTLYCECDNGYHCQDVAWFKGPTDPTSSAYEMVYTRTTYSKPTPTEYRAYGDWIERASLNGDSLVISDVRQSDVGRYWCELRASGYIGVGEHATDAKSMVLDVTTSTSFFNCLNMADGIYADLQSCAMYYECVQGRMYHKYCPRGTVLDTSTAVKTCKSPDRVASACGVKNLQ